MKDFRKAWFQKRWELLENSKYLKMTSWKLLFKFLSEVPALTPNLGNLDCFPWLTRTEGSGCGLKIYKNNKFVLC